MLVQQQEPYIESRKKRAKIRTFFLPGEKGHWDGRNGCGMCPLWSYDLRAHRWQDLLDAADSIHPLFPHLVDEPEPLGCSRLIKNARAQLQCGDPGQH